LQHRFSEWEACEKVPIFPAPLHTPLNATQCHSMPLN
jgi:hypothetical protein